MEVPTGSLEEALADYFLRVDRGETIDLSQWIADFPDFESALRRFFEGQQEIQKQLQHHLQSPHHSTSSMLAVPDRIGRFAVKRVLGVGGFGIVYLADDEQLKRSVALKVPLPQFVADPERRRRFEAEAAAAAQLNHPGIVAVHEANFSGIVPYIASAYCPGPSLAAWLEDSARPIPSNETMHFMAQLADAVHYAHQHEVYHRDLKPANVMLLPRDKSLETADRLSHFTPQLTDFGLAKCTLWNDYQTQSSVMMGTPHYMAPEQLESVRGELPVQADVYSLGCICYQLLTGVLPITADSYLELLQNIRLVRPSPLRERVRGLPRDLERICGKCLEKDPQARYPTAAALAEDLRACADGRPIRGGGPHFFQRLRYWFTRPERITDAGWYTLSVQLLLIVWLTSGVVGAALRGLIATDEWGRVAGELLLLAGVVHLPMAFVGWLTIRRKPWAVPVGLFLSTLNLLLPLVFVLLPIRLFFNDLYTKVDDSGYFAFVVCALMLLAEAGQVVLYTAAACAQRRLGHGAMRQDR